MSFKQQWEDLSKWNYWVSSNPYDLMDNHMPHMTSNFSTQMNYKLKSGFGTKFDVTMDDEIVVSASSWRGTFINDKRVGKYPSFYNIPFSLVRGVYKTQLGKFRLKENVKTAFDLFIWLEDKIVGEISSYGCPSRTFFTDFSLLPFMCVLTIAAQENDFNSV